MEFKNKYKENIVLLYVLVTIAYSVFVVFDIAFWSLFSKDSVYVCTVIFFHLLLFIICINKIVLCVKNSIIIKNGFITFCSVSHFFKTKICINDIKHITFEKNSIIHDNKYDEEAIIIDIFINETMHRIALKRKDFEDFKNIPQICYKLKNDKPDDSSTS